MMISGRRHQIVSEIIIERTRQDAKFPDQILPWGGSGVYENGAAAAKALCDAKHETGTLTWLDVLVEEVFAAMAEVGLPEARAELIQVAATVLRIVEAIDAGEAE